MTIRDVLTADWDVRRISVTVRIDGKFIAGYKFGPNFRVPNSWHYVEKTKAGDIYSQGNSKFRYLVVDVIIQHYDAPKKKREFVTGHGLEDGSIPDEILNLNIWTMMPEDCGHADGMHGYDFECETEFWNGIPGEYEQIDMEADMNASESVKSFAARTQLEQLNVE